MSKFRTLLATSLLVTLPFMSVQADDHERLDVLEMDDMEIAVIVDPTDSDNLDSDTIRAYFFMDGQLNLTENTSIEFAARVDDTIDDIADKDIDKEEFWKTFERLSLNGKLGVEFKIGKLDAEFGNSVAKSNQAHLRDNPLNQVSQMTESVQGVQITGLDIIPNSKDSKVIAIANAALSGVTMTFYDPSTEDEMDLNAFKNLSDGIVISKLGAFKVLGQKIDYKASVLDAGDESRQSLEVSTTWEDVIGDRDIRTYVQHISMSKIGDYDFDNSATLVGAETVLQAKYVKGMKASIEYTNQAESDEEGALGDTIALNLSKQVYSNERFAANLAGSIFRDLDNDDNGVAVKATVRF